MSGTGEVDLSGRWAGLYNYPDGAPPTAFEAELSERSGAVTGTTTELGDRFDCAGRILHAVIDGRREGSALSFLKMYDGSASDYDVVRYEGVVQPGGDEIEGNWTVPGIWSGTFLMVRSAGTGAAIERKVGETV